MSNLDTYLGRTRGLFISLADRLTQSERYAVDDLIEHGEPAEGMRAGTDYCRKPNARACLGGERLA